MSKAKEAVAELAVTWSNVNIGDATARVGFRVPRRELSLSKADMVLCEKRLRVTIVARSSGGPDQESLPGAEADTTIAGTADVRSFGVGKKHISAGLTFNLEEIDVSELALFAKRDGRLRVEAVGDIPENADDGGEEEEEEDEE